MSESNLFQRFAVQNELFEDIARVLRHHCNKKVPRSEVQAFEQYLYEFHFASMEWKVEPGEDAPDLSSIDKYKSEPLVALTFEQLRKLKHAVGYDSEKPGFRCHYQCEPEDDWDQMVRFGLAIQGTRLGLNYYWVTDDGFKFLGIDRVAE